MNEILKRYHNDPYFHAFVNILEHTLWDHHGDRDFIPDLLEALPILILRAESRRWNHTKDTKGVW